MTTKRTGTPSTECFGAASVASDSTKPSCSSGRIATTISSACEGRERVADREPHVRLARAGLDGLAGERFGGLLGDGLGSIERLLVVREPVEEALTHRRYDDLDRVGVADLSHGSIVRLLDGADDEDIPGHRAGKLLALALG